MRPWIILWLAVAGCDSPTQSDSATVDACSGPYGCTEGIELCDGVDNDGDGEVDEADALDALAWFPDADADGWGDETNPTVACSGPAGSVDRGGDCDDGDPTIHALVPELCDGIDQDCDGQVDESPQDGVLCYRDIDGDGYGDAEDGHGASARVLLACEPPSGFVENEGDCDDRDGDVNPAAVEICGDGIDQDCDGGDAECA